MRLATFTDDRRTLAALARDGVDVDLGALAARLGLAGPAFPAGRALVEALVAGSPGVLRTLEVARTADPAGLPAVPPRARRLPPVPDPGQVFAVGLNYRSHCAEQGREPPAAPMYFHKAVSCLAADGDDVVAWPLTAELDYEGELAVVIGLGGRAIPEAEALDRVFGYTVGNDVTARDLQRGDRQWSRAKGLDTFGPMGPVVATRDEVPDPARLRIRTTLNGAVVQDAPVADMAHGVARIVAHLSQAITLRPGDVVLTGTPAGVGLYAKPPRFLQPGDEVAVEIDPIGRLRNRVVAAGNR